MAHTVWNIIEGKGHWFNRCETYYNRDILTKPSRAMDDKVQRLERALHVGSTSIPISVIPSTDLMNVWFGPISYPFADSSIAFSDSQLAFVTVNFLLRYLVILDLWSNGLKFLVFYLGLLISVLALVLWVTLLALLRLKTRPIRRREPQTGIGNPWLESWSKNPRFSIIPTTLTGLVESLFADLDGLFLANTVWSSFFSLNELNKNLLRKKFQYLGQCH